MKRLWNDIIKIDVTPVKTERLYDLNGTEREYSRTFHLCRINGDLYVRKSELCVDANNYINNLIRNNKVSGNILHAIPRGYTKYLTGKVSVMIKASFLLEKKKELMDYLNQQEGNRTSINHTRLLYETITSGEEVVDNIILTDIIEKTEESYALHKKLVNQSTKERREDERQKQKEREEVKRNRENQDLTLQELVERIEAMGWTVTLQLKPRKSQ